MSEPQLLARTAARLRRAPGFISFELHRYQQVTRCDPADEFQLPNAALAQLALCRRPRINQFAADLTTIADRVGVQPEALANFLRTSDAVIALASRKERAGAKGGTKLGVLAAARDRSDEYTEFEDPARGRPLLPGWLGGATDRFWHGNEPPSTFPRDLDLHILTSLPLAIIEIDNLTVAEVGSWMRRHHLPEILATADRPLRGCLAAYAGIGVLFVDKSDALQQRRLTLAHEVAHFILDYMLPREEVARRRPELLDVLDGERPATNTERFDSLLADVPIGFHTHLLERDPHGGHLSNAAANVEDRVERLSLELLAPLTTVLHLAQDANTEDLSALLQEQFGLPIAVAIRYANHLRGYLPQQPRSLLDAIGLGDAVDLKPPHPSGEKS